MPVRDERTNPDDEQPQQNEEQAHPILDDMPDEPSMPDQSAIGSSPC
ncbi:MAG: hypothetical protein ACJA07_000161 [Rhodococcus sp. (in: high G+C Gram-positive bacteria)]|jgi:hypothetical protein